MTTEHDAPTSAPETGNTVAVEEALSPLAQLRIKLDLIDSRKYKNVDNHQRYCLVSADLHLLFDEIDRLNRELQKRDAELAKANKKLSWSGIFEL